MVEITNIAQVVVEPRRAARAPSTTVTTQRPVAPQSSSDVDSGTKSISIEAPGVHVNVDLPRGASRSISSVVSEANNNLRIINADLAIEVDEELKQVIFKVIDLETGETIKQIPSEEMIRIAKKLKEIVENYSKSHPTNAQLFMDSGSFA